MKNRILTLLAAAAMALAGNAQESDASTQYGKDGRHKGLDFNLSTGYHVGVGDNKGFGSIPVEVGFGKQFNPNLYFGLGSGVWIGTKDVKPQIPISLDVKAMFPQKPGGVKPVIGLRLGYLLNTESGGTVTTEVSDGFGGVHQMDVEVEDPGDMVLMEIMPGLQFPLSRSADFLLSAGYTHGFATKGGGGGGYFTVKAGLNFHRDVDKKKRPRRPPREKVDTRDRGFQMTIEANANKSEGWGMGTNLVCSYKINPHFSAGLGVGFEWLNPFAGDTYVTEGGPADVQIINQSQDNYTGAYRLQEELRNFDGALNGMNFFARGVYRITEKRLSPFVSVDLGIKKYLSPDNFGNTYYSYSAGGGSVDYSPNVGTDFFVSPAVGLSLRTTNNSYLELKAGYFMAPNMDSRKEAINENLYLSTASKSLSHLYISLGFTHTFGKRGKRPAH